MQPPAAIPSIANPRGMASGEEAGENGKWWGVLVQPAREWFPEPTDTKLNYLLLAPIGGGLGLLVSLYLIRGLRATFPRYRLSRSGKYRSRTVPPFLFEHPAGLGTTSAMSS